MAVQYNKLFKMMIDRKMTNNQLAKQAGISLNIQFEHYYPSEAG